MAFLHRPSSITKVRLLFNNQETHDVTVEAQVHLPQPRAVVASLLASK